MAAAARKAEMKIRRARRSDAARIAELSGQLGYPATTAQIARRLGELAPASRHALFVAEVKDAGSSQRTAGSLIGWLHVSITNLVEVDPRAEATGLLVAEGQRSRRTGRPPLEPAA